FRKHGRSVAEARAVTLPEGATNVPLSEARDLHGEPFLPVASERVGERLAAVRPRTLRENF
uniref:Uncharacterized protein n=1 Tax=Anopheles dirus TaxID=7168 RepID=A0A182N4S2_9DIPT